METRVLLAGLMAAGTAYLVQASFHTQVFSLSLLFWAILGLVAAVALDAGVPDTLRPGALLGAPPAAEGRPGDGSLPLAPGRVLDLEPREAGSPPDGRALAAGVTALAVVALAGWWALGPYRGGAAARDAQQQAQAADAYSSSGQADAAQTAALQAIAHYRDAIAADPWAPRYRARLADVQVALAEGLLALDGGEGTRRRALLVLAEARDQYRRAADMSHTFGDDVFAADGLAKMSELDVPDREQLQDDAIALYRRALERNPWSLAAAEGLASVHLARGDADEGLKVLQAMLARQVRDVDRVKMLAAVATFHDERGATDEARAAWQRVLALDPDHADAKTALSAA